MLKGYYATVGTFVLLLIAAIVFLILMHTKQFDYMKTKFEKGWWLFVLISSVVVILLLVYIGIKEPGCFEDLKQFAQK